MQNPLVPISGQDHNNLIERERRLYYYDGPDKVITSEEMIALVKSKERPAHSMKTGLGRLDDAIGGIESGELIAIGGPTKNGKTLLAQTITHNLAAQGVGCLWFTFEVPAHQFLAQLPNCARFFMPTKLNTGNMDWLMDRIEEGKLKYQSHIVFIDNLHHLVDFTSIRNVSLDMGVVIRKLKRMAVDLNIAIVILCHSRKTEKSHNGYIPEVSEWDLRDSSFIPQECDATIMVQRKQRFDKNDKPLQEFTNEAIVKVCLHRRTGVLGKKIHVVKTSHLLEEDARCYV